MNLPHPRSTFTACVLTALTVLAAPTPVEARVEAHFSSVRGVNLDEVVLEAWALAEGAARRGEPATIDIAIFSFTTQELADELLRMARDNPTLRIRVLADLSQLSQSQRHMSPYLEFAAEGDYRGACKVVPSRHRRACRDRLEVILEGALLENIEVAYKYYDAYVYGVGGRIGLEHRLSKLMHHKFVVVNGDHLVTGSYNFSPTARRKNYENLMVFAGANERDLVADFSAEFEAMWSDGEIVLLGAAVRQWRRALIADMYQALEE